jgi:ABC-type multidrug transport system fused ATPase/permease subunit
MVVHADALRINLGPLTLHIGLGPALAVALAVATMRLALQVLISWLPARIATDIQARLRRELLAAYTQAAWAVQSEDREGLLQELMTNQINQMTQIVVQVVTAFSGTAMFLSLAVAALLLSPIAALAILAAATCLFFLLRPMARMGRAAGRDLSQANVAHASGVGEAVRLTEEIQVFGAAAATRERIGGLISAARSAFFRFQLLGGLVRNLYQGLVIILIISGLFVLHLTGSDSPASLGAVVLMLVRASTYAQQFQTGFQSLHQLSPYLERIEGAMERYSASTQLEGPRSLRGIDSLEFRVVGYSYRSGISVLREVDFSVTTGESIGVVGPSGAGKSTLVQLLLRLRAPTVGSYLVNGVPASSYKAEDWRRCIAYLPQDPRIFGGSIRDNIRFFRPITDTEVELAARSAHIHDTIIALPEGYDTVIGQIADAVSGGQRQRICLARALAARPGILILDEPTSALDSVSERAVQASLYEMHGQVTMFIVAHRLSTLSNCDRIFAMRAGQLQIYASLADLPDSGVDHSPEPADDALDQSRKSERS